MFNKCVVFFSYADLIQPFVTHATDINTLFIKYIIVASIFNQPPPNRYIYVMLYTYNMFLVTARGGYTLPPYVTHARVSAV